MGFDGVVAPAEVAFWSASRYIDLAGSVYREDYGYPNRRDNDNDQRISQQSRRVGMLNFKMLGQDPAIEGSQFIQRQSELDYRGPLPRSPVNGAAVGAGSRSGES